MGDSRPQWMMPTQCVIRRPLVLTVGIFSPSTARGDCREMLQKLTGSTWFYTCWAKCKYTECGSNPKTGWAASKIKPQSHGNLGILHRMAASAARRSSRSIRGRRKCSSAFGRGNTALCFATWASWFTLLQICWGFQCRRPEKALLLSLHGYRLLNSAIQHFHFGLSKYGKLNSRSSANYVQGENIESTRYCGLSWFYWSGAPVLCIQEIACRWKFTHRVNGKPNGNDIRDGDWF